MFKFAAKRWIALAIFAAIILAVPACQSGGHFELFGYSTVPNYDESIKTIYVPIFKNRTFRRAVEFDLTKAVIREIESKTPYKVVSNRESADTELLGTVVGHSKQMINFTPLGEIREAESRMSVEIVWLDLRPGGAGRPLSQPVRPNVIGETPDIQGPLPVVPLLVQSASTYIPEIGGSLTSSDRRNVDRIAIQIVSMMEKGW